VEAVAERAAELYRGLGNVFSIAAAWHQALSGGPETQDRRSAFVR
jgi:hypothetical protein